MIINDVMNTCMTKAEDEEVGCSRRAWRSCFHRGPDTVSGASKVTLALRLWKISSTSWISSLVGAAPRRRERGIGDDSDMPFDCGVAACHTVREANQVGIGGPIARPLTLATMALPDPDFELGAVVVDWATSRLTVTLPVR